MAKGDTIETQWFEKIEVDPYVIATTPIFKIKVHDWKQVKENILSIVDWDQEDCWMNNRFSDYTKNLKRANKCPEYEGIFVNELFHEINTFSKHIGKNLKVVNLWAQRCLKGSIMMAHNHGVHGITAILYTEYDKKKHNTTKFIPPVDDWRSQHTQPAEIDVEEGDMLFFPSTLVHYTEPNTSNKPRTLFSLNLKFNGDRPNEI